MTKNLSKKLFVLFAIGFMIAISSIAVSANADGPKITSPAQYSEHPYSKYIVIRWQKPDSIYGTVDYYEVSARLFEQEEKVINTNAGTSVINDRVQSAITSYTISGNKLLNWYSQSTDKEKYAKYRLSVCAVMKDGTKRWSDHLYFYTSAHRPKDGSPMSFHIYNGFADDTKNQIYYSCQNWNNALNLGREALNTYPYSSGTDLTGKSDKSDGINIVTKASLGTTGTVMLTNSYYYESTGIAIEADIYVNRDVEWSNSSTPNKFNFYNTIMHEMGHVIGLIDKYDSWASEWTMYGNTVENESKKITLESHDITYGKALFD